MITTNGIKRRYFFGLEYMSNKIGVYKKQEMLILRTHIYSPGLVGGVCFAHIFFRFLFCVVVFALIVFVLCLVSIVACVSGLSIFDCPSVLSNVFDIDKIDKIGHGNLCLNEINLSFSNTYIIQELSILSINISNKPSQC